MRDIVVMARKGRRYAKICEKGEGRFKRKAGVASNMRIYSKVYEGGKTRYGIQWEQRRTTEFEIYNQLWEKGGGKNAFTRITLP